MRLPLVVLNIVGWFFAILGLYFLTLGPTWSLVLGVIFFALTLFVAYKVDLEEKRENAEKEDRIKSETAKRIMDFIFQMYSRLAKVGYVPLDNTTVSLAGVLAPPAVIVQYSDALSQIYKYDEFEEESLSEGFALVSEGLIAVFLTGEKETNMVFAKKQ